MARRPGPPGEVRLIGGRFKRSRLPVPDVPGLRPTPDRVRETLFNWLGQDLSGWRCLDAFAGSGALGLEAASRGAAEVLLLEQDADAAATLRVQCVRLGAAGVQVLRTDAMAWMAHAGSRRFDLVLLDPPFDAGLLDAAVERAAPLVVEGGFLYAEGSAPLRVRPEPFDDWRELRAGAVHATLLRRRYTAADATRSPPS